MSVTDSATRRTRVLYLYNVPDWAIHNIGRDWAALLSDTHDVTLKQFGHHESEDPHAFDHVVWGYSTLDYSGRTLLKALGSRPLGWLRWRAGSPRFAAIVQDPCELFPERPDWKEVPPRASRLARFERLAVTSNEMKQVLAGLGRDAFKINTRSLLPLRDRNDIVTEPLRVISRARDYPRKNLPLIHALRRRFATTVAGFDVVVGDAVLPQAEYVSLLDRANCYLCTSWQEGGPLPLMDALRRGCVALTTRVGQTDERIEHGVNGFFCDGEEDFAHRIEELRRDPALLRRMRLATLERAADSHEAELRRQLREFLP